MQDPRIPVTVITGFLGAGKTTLLNQLVKQPALQNSAVLINEFGDIGIDHHLVDSVDDNVVVLDSGCLCCTVNGDLHRALWALFQRASRREIARLDRVVIETSGLADPTPLIYSIIKDPLLCQRFRCDGIITLVDAVNGNHQLNTYREALKQVAVADKILISKSDLINDENTGLLRAKLGIINPFAAVSNIRDGNIKAEEVLQLGLFDLARKPEEVKKWLGEEATLAQSDHHGHEHHPEHNHDQAAPTQRHTQGLDSFVLRFSQPFHWGALSQAIDMLLNSSGDQILRIKGIINTQDETQPRVIQCVQHLRYPALTLNQWPDQHRRSRMVFITRDYPRDYVEKAFEIFCGQMPDRDN